MRPYGCVNFLGDGSCLKGHRCICVELKGIYCTVFDPVEEDDEEYETWRYNEQAESDSSV